MASAGIPYISKDNDTRYVRVRKCELKKRCAALSNPGWLWLVRSPQTKQQSFLRRRRVIRRGGWYGCKLSSSSNFSIRAFRAHPPIEIGQRFPVEKFEAAVSQSTAPPPLLGYPRVRGARVSDRTRWSPLGDFSCRRTALSHEDPL